MKNARSRRYEKKLVRFNPPPPPRPPSLRTVLFVCGKSPLHSFSNLSKFNPLNSDQWRIEGKGPGTPLFLAQTEAKKVRTADSSFLPNEQIVIESQPR